MSWKYVVLVFVLHSLFFLPAFSGEGDSLSVSGSIKSFLGLDQPTFGVLAQVKGYAYNKDSRMILAGAGNRFYISLHGDLSRKFQYRILGSFLENYRLLDLKFSYNFEEYLGIDFGRLKTAFGREFLSKPSMLFFVRQASLTSSLGPQRQDGLQLRGKLFDQRFSYSAGVFGGEGITINSKTGSLYIGKLSFVPLQYSSVKLDLSGSLAYSNDENDYYDLALFHYPGTSRKFINADFNLGIDDMQFIGEFTRMSGSTFGRPEGFYVDVTKKLTGSLEGGVRFDFMNYPSVQENIYSYKGLITRTYIAGINWYPEEGIKMQLDLEREPIHSFTTITLMFQYGVNQ